MGQDSFRPAGKGDAAAAGRRPGRASLRVRLVAAALCLLAAGAMAITGACALLARGYLAGQADRQLRAAAGQLISRPFTASPIYGIAPGTPSAGYPGGGVLGIEVRGPAGQLVMRAGPGTRPGPLLPAVPVPAAARAGQPVTIAAGGAGSWRVITEPIHYRARRIPFSYSAEGFSVLITGRARPGLAGTLVVGLEVGGIGHAVGRLAVTGLALSGVLAVAVACLGGAVIRAILRPIDRAEAALAVAAAGGLSHRVPAGRTGGDAGRLTRSLNTMLGQLEHALAARAESEAAARRSGERMSLIFAGTGHELRRPLSVIHGLAGSYRRRGRPTAAELDRQMERVAGEAARMDALVDELAPGRLTRPSQPRPPQR